MASTGPLLTLIGEDVPADTLAPIVAQTGLPVSEHLDSVANSHAPVVLTPTVQRERLVEQLDFSKGLACIELGAVARDIAALLTAPRLTTTLAEGGIYLALSTVTAFTLDSANILCDSLSRRGLLGDGRRDDVELSLHEAISNAVVHGNLGMQSEWRDGAEAHRLYTQRIMGRLTDEALANRHVEIAVTWQRSDLRFDISDQGQGNALADRLNLQPNPDDAESVRGLALITHLAKKTWVSDEGRCLSFSFDC